MQEHVRFATVLHRITQESITECACREDDHFVLYECGCCYFRGEQGIELCRYHEGMENGLRRALKDDGR
jgi:hypothetical protein